MSTQPTTRRPRFTIPARVLVVVLSLACLLATRAASAQTESGLTSDSLFDTGEMQDLWLRVNARDWADLQNHYLDSTYYPADFEWRGMVVRNVGIRSRGRASRSATKPGLSVDFNRYVNGQNFLGLKSLVLDNQWQDPSMMHERLSMLVFQRMGVPAPREAYVRLYVGPDRTFIGVYAVVEAIDKAFLMRTLQENDGHLYQYNNVDPYHFEDRDQDLRWYADRFEPKTHENESSWSLYAPIKELVQTVNLQDDNRMQDELPEYLNLPQVATFLAVQNVLSQKDGLAGAFGMANFYLYRYQAKRLFQFIPWDQDLAFDDLGLGPADRLDTNILTARIWNTPALRELYLDAVARTEHVLDEQAECQTAGEGRPCTWLEREIDAAYEQIREGVYADPVMPYQVDTFEQAVDFLRTFARERSVVLGSLMEQIVASPSRP